MNARTVARELALLTLFQIEKQGTDIATVVKDKQSLGELVLRSVRSLVAEAQDNIESSVKDIASVSQAILEIEAHHPDNLALDLEAENNPVPIPTTREMVEKLDKVLQGAEFLAEAFRLPELLALAKRDMVKAYTQNLMETIVDNTEALDALINECSDEWRADRLHRIDRRILHIALAEMKIMGGVDHSVSINEAVDLAKKFSEPESYRLINGILGNAAEKLNPDQEAATNV